MTAQSSNFGQGLDDCSIWAGSAVVCQVLIKSCQISTKNALTPPARNACMFNACAQGIQLFDVHVHLWPDLNGC